MYPEAQIARQANCEPTVLKVNAQIFTNKNNRKVASSCGAAVR
jgi:hypothetical protein